MVLTKEYRIPLPLTVEEYRIAQLYMIAKKSRMESYGEDCGVQILVNEPYTDGPGPTGTGQYTRKVYYIASHLPGWLKALIPKSALTVEEEAWNAYPYTKTRFTCSIVEKFSIEVETVYTNDGGHQSNIFNLSKAERKQIESDLIDVVKDQIFDAHYLEAEDPTIYKSEKTGRGPLTDSWIKDYWSACEGKETPLPDGKAIMCAYKLCKVEFKYWGMQSKIEKFIHDVALRKTMLRAHQQAWVWQDEWWGLTIEDIRSIEQETMTALMEKYALQEEEDEEGKEEEEEEERREEELYNKKRKNMTSSVDEVDEGERRRGRSPSPPVVEVTSEGSPRVRIGSEDSGRSGLSVMVGPADAAGGACKRGGGRASPYSRVEWAGSSDSLQDGLSNNRRPSWVRSVSKNTLSSQSQASWRMESIRRDSYSDNSGDEDDEFFDCAEQMSDSSRAAVAAALYKWSSLELLPASEPPTPEHAEQRGVEPMVAPTPGTPMSMRLCSSPVQHCPTSILVMVLHAGSVLESTTECSSKGSDLTTFRHTFECVVRQHYPILAGGGIAFRLLPIHTVTAQALQILATMSGNSGGDGWVPVGALPVITDGTTEYLETVQATALSIQASYKEFLASQEGLGFNGHVCIVGDSVAGLMLYDVLCQDTAPSVALPGDDHGGSAEEQLQHHAPPHPSLMRQLSDQSCLGHHMNSPQLRRRGSWGNRLDYESCDVFLLGCPLGLMLLKRRMHDPQPNQIPTKPHCHQLYNLFHPTDPLALRLEPLISPRMALLPPVTIPRYTKHPLGDAQPTHLLREVWWGSKRLDYALYCPDGLTNFPPNSLPHLFHASFWESTDVAAFILRQVVRSGRDVISGDKELPVFSPSLPREKWLKKRTSVKLKNVNANHRGNDVIVKCGSPQTLHARFMYGPLDMVALTGEKVDVHVMRTPPNGEWQQVCSHITDKTGRLTVTLPSEEELPTGVYPIKMVVRGDHSSCMLWLAVVPAGTQMVVFSIDGSLTASVSVSGKDPKVRPGAVDVLRVWQQKGYMLLYITGRPDLQQHKVLSWLTKHNFPHGLVSFVEGITTDPLGHKASYLRSLIQDQGVVFQSAYGSSKDISVYSSLGLSAEQIYVVGKANKKQHTQAQVLSDGYSAHLAELSERLRTVQCSPQLALNRTFFAPAGGVRAHRLWTTSSVSNSPCARRLE